jgi:hypothetical protein
MMRTSQYLAVWKPLVREIQQTPIVNLQLKPMKRRLAERSLVSAAGSGLKIL